MKNIFKSLVLFAIAMIFVVSCASKPEPKPEPVEKPVVVEEEVTEPEPMPEPEPEMVTVSYETYTVVKGDTLSQIAERFYGNKDKAYFFPIIMVYNLDTISILDPDVIEPGMMIRIPNFDEFMASPDHVAAAKIEFEKDAVLYQRKGRTGVAKMLRERSDRM